MTKTMKILCPTDFSDHSIHAVKYAVNIANILNAELHIVSSFIIPQRASTFASIEDSIRENTEEDMDELVNSILTMITTDITPISKVYKGKPVDIILRYIRKFDIDFAILGTQGNNSLHNLLFGSVTRKLVQKCSIPVLAIPQSIEFKLTGNKMLLSLDNKVLENESTFEIPKMIANKLGLKIDIIHVSKEKEDFPIDPFISTYLDSTLGDVIIKSGNNPVDEIKKYAESHFIGMVIMIRRSKGFFQKLLTVGNTSEELATTNIPLLILPE